MGRKTAQKRKYRQAVRKETIIASDRYGPKFNVTSMFKSAKRRYKKG